jgi:hypothetical protein
MSMPPPRRTWLLATTFLLGASAAHAQEAPAEPTPAEAPAATDVAAPAAAEPAPPEDHADWEQRLKDLEVRERALEEAAQKEAEAPAAEAKKAEAFTLKGAPGKGLTLSTGDAFSLNLRFRAQIRDTVAIDEESVANEIQIRTLRLVTQGNILVPDLKYTIQLAFGSNDFEKDNPSPIFDAFVDYTAVRDANFRVGQFFVPLDRARTIREFALQLVDRQQVVRELTLDRDVGIMVSSSDLFGLNGLLAYNLFVGGGDGRNHFGAAPPGPLVVARAIVRPFGAFDDDQEGDLTRDLKPRLAIGVAGGYNRKTARQGSTTGTTFKLGEVDYAHAAADVVLKWAGFSLLTEGVWRQAQQEKLEGELDGKATVERTRSGAGYFVQGGYLLTENVEVVGRWDDLYALGDTDPKLVDQVAAQGRQVVGGVNVYLNGHALKVQSDVSYLFGEDFTQGKGLVRVQLDASF